MLEVHGGRIDGLIAEIFGAVSLSKRQKTQLRKMIAAGLLGAAPSNFSTGVIVAGYAPGDMFPSLAMVEVDGTVCGKLKYMYGEHVVLDRENDPPGRVISFAQTDVADRLLSGADTQFVDKSAAFIAASLLAISAQMVLESGTISAPP